MLGFGIGVGLGGGGSQEWRIGTERSSGRKVSMVLSDRPTKISLPPTRRGPVEPLPERFYSPYDENVLNKFFMTKMQRGLENDLGVERGEVSFERIVDLAKTIHKLHPTEPLVNIFETVFGPALPTVFRAVFASNFPDLSLRLAAIVTALGSVWLMGPNKVVDKTTVEIERCRFLEEAGCVNVCVNGCKKPTEAFIKKALNVDLHMEPNYDDFSCKFKFGVKPPPEKEDPAFNEPCFLQCPTATRRMKSDGFNTGSRCENIPMLGGE